LAHDLRAPLATIATCAELLPRLSSDPAKVDEAAKRIGRAAGRMERLITDLLEYGRGAALGLPVVAHPTDIGKLCTELCDELAVAQPDRRITLRLQDDLVVSCDRHRVGQALSNLIRNALQHGVGDVSMAATRSVHGVQIEVSNVGPGIPEDLLPAIFDPLARRRLGFGSLGLGLAIVREVARAHGGGVSVRSEDGRTTFQLWLPSSPPELLTEGASTPLATPHTVLVVDDDPDLRDGVSDALRAAGHEVACAADGAEAWELLGGGRALPDAIVLDVAMPVMDGVAFRRRQLADERLAGIPVVVVTSLDRLPEQGDLAARVVRKPFTIDVLERALATVYGESLRSPASAR
jgi:CheY-like chemotaxis protein